jgi:transcription elongation factor Elf1
MPDMNIFCEQCGADRFDVITNTRLADTVQSIICSVCGRKIRVDDVVIFREVMYLSGTSEPEFKGPSESPPV